MIFKRKYLNSSNKFSFSNKRFNPKLSNGTRNLTFSRNKYKIRTSQSTNTKIPLVSLGINYKILKNNYKRLHHNLVPERKTQFQLKTLSKSISNQSRTIQRRLKIYKLSYNLPRIEHKPQKKSYNDRIEKASNQTVATKRSIKDGHNTVKQPQRLQNNFSIRYLSTRPQHQSNY